MNEPMTMRPSPLRPSGRLKHLGIAALAFGLLLAIFSVVIIETGQVGVVVRAGSDAPNRVIATPGIYGRLPFVDRVWLVDTRWQTSEETVLQAFKTADQQSLDIAAWAVWRVKEPLRFNTVANATKEGIAEHLDTALNQSLSAVVAAQPARVLYQGVSANLQAAWLEKLNALLDPMGMEVAQVGIRQIGFPETLTKTVFQTMVANSQQGSQSLIQGLATDEQQLTALQSRQREAVLDKAYRQTQQVRQSAENRLVEAYAAQYGQPNTFRSLLQAPLSGPSPSRNQDPAADKAD